MDLLRQRQPAISHAPYNRAFLIVLAGFVVAAFAAMSWFLTRKPEPAALPGVYVSLEELRQQTAEAAGKAVSAKELEKATTTRTAASTAVSADVLLRETSDY